MVDALLETQHVTFGYDQQILLYDVSLQIVHGEMIGLLGPNGSGKTTLLRLISGILQPQQGQVVLEGRTLRQWGRRKVAQRIAVVPQELYMPFDFTVEQMVELGRTPFINSFWGSRSIQDHRLVQECMQATGIDNLATRVFHELSGGERQRVILAMALAQQPALLLLDEPTSHLDIKYQVEILELTQQLNREHSVTIVAAMHDLNLAARYFPRLLLFQRGIVADASPTEVLEPGLLSRVYGIQVQVGILRGSEHLSVLPPTSAEEHEEGRGKPFRPTVHVIAGGGSGEMMMRALADLAIPFAAGALNIGDSDHALALRLASQVVTEQPFAPISSAALKLVRESLTHVRLLVLCPTAIGTGNLALIEETVQAAKRGLPVVVLNSPDTNRRDCISNDNHRDNGPDDNGASPLRNIAARDYTGGKGIKIMEELLQTGAIIVSSVSEALEVIKQKLAASNALPSNGRANGR